MKILKTLDSVIEAKKIPESEAKFLRAIVSFECYENTFRYKVKYREELERAVKENQ